MDIPKRVGELEKNVGNFNVRSMQVGAADPFFLEPANWGYLRRRSHRRMGETSVQSLKSARQRRVS